jgi:hypothetical protein
VAHPLGLNFRVAAPSWFFEGAEGLLFPSVCRAGGTAFSRVRQALKDFELSWVAQPLRLNFRVARAWSLNFGCPVLRFLKGGVFDLVL